jgi:hypothetical protein
MPWRRDLLGGVVFGVLLFVLAVMEVVWRCCGKRAWSMLLSRCRGPMGVGGLEMAVFGAMLNSMTAAQRRCFHGGLSYLSTCVGDSHKGPLKSRGKPTYLRKKQNTNEPKTRLK